MPSTLKVWSSRKVYAIAPECGANEIPALAAYLALMADASLSLALVGLVLDPKFAEKYAALSAAEQQSLFDFLCLSRGALERAYREAVVLDPAVGRVSLDRFLRRCQEIGLRFFEIEAS